MDKQQIANLLRIQHASRTDKLVVFVGAGVSQNSGIPTWNNLICSMMEELPSELSKENDVLKLAQMYKDSRGHKEYMDKIKNVLLYNWRKRSIPTHSGWLYPLTFDAGKGLKEA